MTDLKTDNEFERKCEQTYMVVREFGCQLAGCMLLLHMRKTLRTIVLETSLDVSDGRRLTISDAIGQDDCILHGVHGT